MESSTKIQKEIFFRTERYCEIIDNIDLQVEDTYTFYTYNSQRDIVSLTPLTDEQKCDIVMEFDSLLRESCLFELIRTLTFNEKLVFFLFYLEEYKNMEVAALLNNAERTILNRRKSIDKDCEQKIMIAIYQKLSRNRKK